MDQDMGDCERVVRTHFRTRQIGGTHCEAHHKQTSQSASSSSSSSANSSELATAIQSSSSSMVTSNVKSSTTSHRELVSQSSSSSLTSSSASSRMRRPTLELRIGTGANGSPSKSYLLDETKQSDLQTAAAQSVQHHSRRSFSSSSSSSCSTSRSMRALADSASVARSLLETKHAKTSAASELRNQHEAIRAASSQCSNSQRHFRTTSSLVLSGSAEQAASFKGEEDNSSNLLSSPNVRSLLQEIGSEFAELENALGSSVSFSFTPTGGQQGFNMGGFRHPKLLGCRRVQALGSARPVLAIDFEPSCSSRIEPAVDRTPVEPGGLETDNGRKIDQLRTSTKELLAERSTGDRIRELLDKAEGHVRPSGELISGELVADAKRELGPGDIQQSESEKREQVNQEVDGQLDQVEKSDDDSPRLRQQAAMNESIERIDQRMSDLCMKLNDCLGNDAQTIELLNIMIQMIEKAWSVPVCGDDLGFRLCNSLRQAGGLDIILGFIQQEENQQGLEERAPINDSSLTLVNQLSQELDKCDPFENDQKSSLQLKNNRSTNPLRLNLTGISKSSSVSSPPAPNSAPVNNTQQPASLDEPTSSSAKSTPYGLMKGETTKDNDSDILTSDLGLDSTSTESLSFVSTVAQPQPQAQQSSCVEDQAVEREDGTMTEPQYGQELAKEANEHQGLTEREELVYLSARLLSQCLTSENRNYLVQVGQNSVIRLACSYTTMKSEQSHRLLTRSRLLSRQASTVGAASSPLKTNLEAQDDKPEESKGSEADDSDIHATIGTEILQHLFKHSEETCTAIMALGGLQAILYGCRSSNIDTLRHCASALANLALYGGPEGQQTMIEQQAHVWLFPLAFNKDDNVQYYACLAIVVLAANQEIEADVLKSGTLDLVEPFVTSHEPRKFAESTTAHIHGQSASWLRRLVPLLKSKREVARNLACFHFAMEAYIKREQGQTGVFKDIGAVEPLRKCAGSPIAIESKFACQALRLIGEKEPHRLSQQVPLWTPEDVVEWLNQIGFERYKGAFVESHVDGDILLQLDDQMLNSDIGMSNGIIRRRFLRELINLKRIADYSSMDKSNLSGALSSGRDCEFVQYIYPLINLGVTRDNIHLLDGDQLLHECQVTNTVHRMKLGQAIKGLQERQLAKLSSDDLGSHEGSLLGGQNKTLDVFVSYRRATGSQLASLLKVHLQLRGFSVFIDVERLEAGKFDNNLLDSIKSARNFVLVLSPQALDRCIGDQECKDWVHKEIVAALASGCNIIPILDQSFHWPDAELLPEDMRSIIYFNGISWSHDYQDACVDKVERFIRGEIYNKASQSATTTATCNSSQRLPGGVSTPSLIATPSSFGVPSRAFESDQHPLSCFANQHLHQCHHQSHIPSSPALRPR